MAKIVYLFVLVALIQVAYAIKCYNCGENVPCPDDKVDKSNWPTLTCGEQNAGGAKGSACLTRISTDSTSKKETIVRRCIITDKANPYVCPQGSTCDQCTTTLCNSASGVRFSFVTLLGVVAVFLIPNLM